MKYCMCAFPLVGALIAVLMAGAYRVLDVIWSGSVLKAGFMTLIPLFVTGGIHMDGYMDTTDARCSYGDRDKKLAILKDPHTGAFAVIHALGYILLTFVLWDELLRRLEDGGDERVLYAVLTGFVISRILSGTSVLLFKKAKKDGMVSSIAGVQDKRNVGILICEMLICAAAAFVFCGMAMLPVLIASAAVMAYYGYVAHREFGGTTGDLAGWFLELCELVILITETVYIILIDIIV